jgi:phosphatidylglycerophosphatase A
VGAEDPQFVVADEVVGQWIALIGATVQPGSWVLAFVLFRFFDIVKPPPARQFDKMRGGFGIMMDDVAAGIYALVLVWIAGRYI